MKPNPAPPDRSLNPPPNEPRASGGEDPVAAPGEADERDAMLDRARLAERGKATAPPPAPRRALDGK